jgi:uncharacterized repeat protein (TIGR02543 family)
MSFAASLTRRIALFLVSLLLVGLLGAAGTNSPLASASVLNSLKLYIDSPFVQGSYVATPSNTMTFDTSATGLSGCADNQPTGVTITGTCRVDTVKDYGGASNSADDTPTIRGSGSQFATTAHASNPVVINLTNQSRYLGMWWSAGSAGNTMRFYNGSDLLLTVTLQDMIDLLGTGPANNTDWAARNNDSASNLITTIGTPSATNRKVWYFGNPRGYTDTVAGSPIEPTSWSTISGPEPFVYLHMFVGGDMTFNKIELSGGGFEFDNLTVSEVAQTPISRLVMVSETAQLEGVRFDSNASGVLGTMARQTGNTATALTSNSYSRTGYTFGGWTTSADGTGTAYANAASYPFTSSTTLYAKWNPISYTVAYDTQGGSAVTAGSYTIGSSVTLPAAPTRSGFTFAGWFTATTGGTALGTSYSPPSTGNITLYAQWTPVATTPAPVQTPVPTPTTAPASLSALAVTGVSEQNGIIGLGFSALLIALGAGFLWIRRRLSL